MNPVSAFYPAQSPFAILLHGTVHYPGVVHGAGSNKQDPNLLTAEEQYAVVKANVDALKPLQVGIAVFTHDVGHLAVWEFNLSDFDPAAHPCATHIAGTVSPWRGSPSRSPAAA
jgi:hypothetical protein